MNKELSHSFITPNWPAPLNVHAIQTTRIGGVSQMPYDSLNLGDHVSDNSQHVARNRQMLSQYVPTEPVWLNQVHGVIAIDAATSRCIENADASYTKTPNVVCVTMTADCLPVLLCDKAGTVVAAVHAGWRSLCDGVVENAVKAMGVPPNQLMAWLGPAIGPEAFEVDEDVRLQFIEKDQQATGAFKPMRGKWVGDLYTIAKQRLESLGLVDIYGEMLCTYSNPDQFFSFRRDGDTGRMATLIWLTA